MKVYGIDFSSAPSKKKPIAVAECWLQGSVSGSCSNNELRLSCFHSIESLDLFEEFLSQRGPWVGGFDLPFSMPRELIEYFDWPPRKVSVTIMGLTFRQAAAVHARPSVLSLLYSFEL